MVVHGAYGLMSHPKNKAIVVKYLAQEQVLQSGLKPNSADQKHQSLSPVLLNAQPWDAK